MSERNGCYEGEVLQIRHFATGYCHPLPLEAGEADGPITMAMVSTSWSASPLGEAARLREGTGGATLVEIGLAEPITEQGIG